MNIWAAQNPEHEEDFEPGGRLEHLYTRQRAKCSCPFCGNPRRHFGKRTRQEIQADDDLVI